MRNRPIYLQLIPAAFLLILAWLLFTLLFQGLPVGTTGLGMDWPGLWRGLRGGVIDYGSGLRNPPWSLIPLLLLGLLPFSASWGALTVLTLSAEVLSVPHYLPRAKKLLAAFLLATCYPSVRNIADGNLELLVIGGILLILAGFRKRDHWLLAGGLLLASGKPQATWLVLLFVLIQVLRSWAFTRVLKAGLAVLGIVSVSLAFYGGDWFKELVGIPHRGTLVDMSLISSLDRLGLPSALIAVLWGGLLVVTVLISASGNWSLSRLKAGFLLTASLMLAPYAAGNSLLSVAAIGGMPLFDENGKMAALLFIFINLPYLAISRADLRVQYGAYYGLVFLFLFWITSGLLIRRKTSRFAMNN